MPRLSEIPKGDSIIMLVYGSTGVGKTEFCGSIGSRGIIINTGMGVMTLKSKGFKSRFPHSNPMIEDVYESYLPEKAEAHNKVCDLMDQYLNDPEYDTICLDDATGLKRHAQNLALVINDDLNKSKSLEQSVKHKTHMMAVQDYGEEMQIIDQFLADYIQLCREKKKNFILTAHERVDYNKPSTIGAPPTVRKVRPGFTGQTFPDSVTGHFDFVWHFEVQGGGNSIIHKARTVGDSALDAKSREGSIFPVLIQDPSFPKVMETIKNA